MSLLSKWTGIGISRKGVKINPKQVLKAGLLTAGGLGAVGMAGLGGFGTAGTLGKLGMAKKIGGALVGSGDPGDGGRFRQIMDLGKAGEGIYDRYQQNRQYNDARKEYEAAAPLREAGMRGLLDTSRPDVSSIFADPMNPQGRYRAVSVGSRGRY